MPLSLHHYPPPGTHQFLCHSWSQACPLIAGFDKEPQHLPIAEALADILEELSKAHGATPIKLTPTLSSALQSPRWGFTSKAVDDFKQVLRSYLQMHGRPVAGPGRQRRWAPIPVATDWMLTAAPHYSFTKASAEQRQAADTAEVERQALAAMSYTAKRRYYNARSRLAITSPSSTEPTP